MTAWECPKCGYVWNSSVIGCYNCNRPDHEKTVTTTTITIEGPLKPSHDEYCNCPECLIKRSSTSYRWGDKP